jgi:hypothetical protein
MKNAGIGICIFSSALLLMAVQLTLTQYNLAHTFDVSRCVGRFLPGVLVLALGIYLYQRGSEPPDPRNDKRQ